MDTAAAGSGGRRCRRARPPSRAGGPRSAAGPRPPRVPRPRSPRRWVGTAAVLRRARRTSPVKGASGPISRWTGRPGCPLQRAQYGGEVHRPVGSPVRGARRPAASPPGAGPPSGPLTNSVLVGRSRTVPQASRKLREDGVEQGGVERAVHRQGLRGRAACREPGAGGGHRLGRSAHDVLPGPVDDGEFETVDLGDQPPTTSSAANTASMPPAGVPSRISRPRRQTSRSPSSVSAPATHRAAYSPALCPATATGSTPNRRHSLRLLTCRAKSAGCAKAVSQKGALLPGPRTALPPGPRTALPPQDHRRRRPATGRGILPPPSRPGGSPRTPPQRAGYHPEPPGERRAHPVVPAARPVKRNTGAVPPPRRHRAQRPAAPLTKASSAAALPPASAVTTSRCSRCCCPSAVVRSRSAGWFRGVR